jgi:hypothetical protein
LKITASVSLLMEYTAFQYNFVLIYFGYDVYIFNWSKHLIMKVSFKNNQKFQLKYLYHFIMLHRLKIIISIIFPMFFGISTINAQLLTDLNTVNLIKKMLIVFIINNSMTHKRYIWESKSHIRGIRFYTFSKYFRLIGWIILYLQQLLSGFRLKVIYFNALSCQKKKQSKLRGRILALWSLCKRNVVKILRW